MFESQCCILKLNGGRVPSVSKNSSHETLNKGSIGYTIPDALFLFSDNGGRLKFQRISPLP